MPIARAQHVPAEGLVPVRLSQFKATSYKITDIAVNGVEAARVKKAPGALIEMLALRPSVGEPLFAQQIHGPRRMAG